MSGSRFFIEWSFDRDISVSLPVPYEMDGVEIDVIEGVRPHGHVDLSCTIEDYQRFSYTAFGYLNVDAAVETQVYDTGEVFTGKYCLIKDNRISFFTGC